MANDASYQTYSPCFPDEEQGEWVWIPKKLGAMPGYPTPHQSPDFNNHMYHSFSEGSCETYTPAMPWAPSSAGTASPVYEMPGLPSASPVEPLFEGFDVDMAFQMPVFPEGTEPWTGAALETAPMDLFNCIDADLFAGFDFGLPLGAPASPPETVSPANSLHGGLDFTGTGSSSPLAPPTPASPLTASDSSASASPTACVSATTQLLPCSIPSCTELFTKQCDLKKHLRKHRQPFRCPLPQCSKGHLDKRALARHLWAQHPSYAAAHNTPSEKVRCSHPGCSYEGRADNVARHGKRHCKGK